MRDTPPSSSSSSSSIFTFAGGRSTPPQHQLQLLQLTPGSRGRTPYDAVSLGSHRATPLRENAHNRGTKASFRRAWPTAEASASNNESHSADITADGEVGEELPEADPELGFKRGELQGEDMDGDTEASKGMVRAAAATPLRKGTMSVPKAQRPEAQHFFRPSTAPAQTTVLLPSDIDKLVALRTKSEIETRKAAESKMKR